MELVISRAGAGDLDEVRLLFREYRIAVDADVCFANYEAELVALPRGYETILLARDGIRSMGCVALRDLGEGSCEMKRLFVQPEAQGLGLGRLLIEAAKQTAIELRYGRMVLDTLPTMGRAIALYRAMGFIPIARYNNNPDRAALFFEQHLC